MKLDELVERLSTLKPAVRVEQESELRSYKRIADDLARWLDELARVTDTTWEKLGAVVQPKAELPEIRVWKFVLHIPSGLDDVTAVEFVPRSLKRIEISSEHSRQQGIIQALVYEDDVGWFLTGGQFPTDEEVERPLTEHVVYEAIVAVLPV